MRADYLDLVETYKEFVTTRSTVKTTRTTSWRQLGPHFEDNSDQYL